MPNWIQLQEHDALFWEVLDADIKGPTTLVNIDAHSDMSMFDGRLDIGNFISKMVDLGIVDRVVWVKDPGSLDFLDGTYRFKIGRTWHGQGLASSLETPFYFLQGSYCPEGQLVNPREVELVATQKTTAPKTPWILSIDYDYFTCQNPRLRELMVVLERLGKDVATALYAKGNMIQSAKEWQEFNAELDKMVPGLLPYMAKCMLPNFTLTEDQIRERVLGLAGSIVDFEGCMGVYLIDSITTGFTDPSKYNLIDDLVKTWLDKAGISEA